ncbi:hypothetical protein SDC9_147403 [bioreactor metagenome]|uniref:Uncharacterized protein n=1 Tax=bioreactor metagenome TaxID=1076179 RepID=A0A645EGE0_9ZZZZ
MWRKGNSFGYPAGKHAGNKGGNSNDYQAAQRSAHHEFQAVARIKQRKEKQHNEIGAGQPMPYQRKSTNKQTEKSEGSFRQIQQMLRYLFLVSENQVQRP